MYAYNEDILVPGTSIRPIVKMEQILDVISTRYELSVSSIEELNGYDDKNYYIQVDLNKRSLWPHGYVLKIMNSLDSKNIDLVKGQNDMMNYLNKKGITVPSAVQNSRGEFYSLEKFEGPNNHLVRLFTYQTGRLLRDVKSSSELYFNLGIFIGHLNMTLKDFKCSSIENRKSIWMLSEVSLLRRFTPFLHCEHKMELVEKILLQFENNVLPVMDNLEGGIVHGDLNDNNILMEGDKVAALLDFGDAHKSPYLFELSICLCYMLFHSKDLSCGKYLLKGYLTQRQLSVLEKQLLKVCVCARFCQSLVLGAYTHSLDPNNSYLLQTQKHGWRILENVEKLNPSELLLQWGLK